MNSKGNKYSHYFFILLLMLSIQVSSDLIIDNLIFKTLLISFITFVWIIVLLLFNKKLKIQYDKLLFFSFFYVLFYSIGIFWSTTYTLSIVGISKLLLFFIIFNVINILYNKNNDILIFLIKAIILSFLLSIIVLVKQISLLEDLSYTSFYSLSGICGHKNLYSSFVFLTLIGSFIGLEYLKKHKFWYIIVTCTLILQIITIIFLRTRAVWLACIISILVYIILSIFNPRKLIPTKIWLFSIVIAIVTTISFTFVLPFMLKGFLTAQPQSTDITKISDLGTFQERIKVWNKTYELIYDNLYWGVGSGSWKINFTKHSIPDIYKVQDLNVIFQRPHNEFLKILSENGIIGLFLFLFLINYFVFKLFNTNNVLVFKSSKYLFSGFMGFSVIMFFSFPLERTEHNLIIIVLLAIAYLPVNNDLGKYSLNISKFFLFIPFIICLVLIVIFQSRYKSSYYIKKMYYERNVENNENVLALCDSAITFFTKFDDFGIPIHWYRGNANASMNNFKSALQDFKSAQRYHPYNAHVLNDLGSAYAMNNKIDSAIYFYESASKINPRFDDPKLNLIAIYLTKMDIVEAKKWESEIFHDSKRRTYYKKLISQMEQNINFPD
ncbi:MAG: O-antigen ligase family protein [bacterium]